MNNGLLIIIYLFIYSVTNLSLLCEGTESLSLESVGDRGTGRAGDSFKNSKKSHSKRVGGPRGPEG